MIRIAVDTNILAYVAGVERHDDDLSKIKASRTLLRRLRERSTLIVPVQALGELFNVLTRYGRTRDSARETVLSVADGLAPADTTSTGFLSALDLATSHKLQIWDALILNAAAESGCIMLLSEDMSEGFTWRRTLVVNPLAEQTDERLAHVLA